MARTCSFINYLSPTLFVGRCCCENIKNGVIRWRKVGLFRRSRHDEKIWSQKYCQITRSLHSDWACLYSYGIHALWRFENISSCKVIIHNICFQFIVLSLICRNEWVIFILLWLYLKLNCVIYETVIKIDDINNPKQQIEASINYFTETTMPWATLYVIRQGFLITCHLFSRRQWIIYNHQF